MAFPSGRESRLFSGATLRFCDESLLASGASFSDDRALLQVCFSSFFHQKATKLLEIAPLSSQWFG
jgi:hypothetical protein